MGARGKKARTFPLDELEGFYIGNGVCVHITFEDEETIAIDLFDDEAAAHNPNRGNVIRTVILGLRTGNLDLEA